ncbi:MAG: diphosphate--fructose-6-phosphate 1-phosphotransferase [Propionibacteriaceae bacterium]|jgi:6-phosphofructokinase 1|nr:diphosphate--fructose-6-phosphate 1-phosphotransferase [Propionibacteriaceae bacterium]
MNCLVALGGGTSPVINASLLGVISSWKDAGLGRIFGAYHGIEGVLLEQLVDLTDQPEGELAKLRHTPASGSIGTCRYKLAPDSEDYGRIVDVLAAHEVGLFVYIGGNDSMDTADKVARLARSRGLDLNVAGVPKTIDNDLGDEDRTLIDHTPGYGSTARYWAMLIRELEEENRGMISEPVSVFQAMGRRAGFITAAARLGDPNRESPLQLYFAETGIGLEHLIDNVDREVRTRGRCMVVLTEGFDVGDIGAARDGFGHVEFGASGTSAQQVVVNALNAHGLPARGLATGQLPGVLQRMTSVFRSTVDVEEAYEVGRKGVEVGLGQSGFMATILRKPGPDYGVYYDKVPLEVIANSERFLPVSWIAPSGIDVTDDFVEYAQPLIGQEMYPMPLVGGLQDFARLERIEVSQKLPEYVPVNWRG